MPIIINSRHDMTLEAYRYVAWKNHAVVLSLEVMNKLASARSDFLELIEDPQISIYGVNTGYGIPPAQIPLAKQEIFRQKIFCY